MRSKVAELEGLLREYERRCGTEGLAIVTTKGLIMASSFQRTHDEKAMSAMAASLQSIGNRVSGELTMGEMTSILIDGAVKTILLMSAAEIIVMGMAPRDSGIALIKFEFGNLLQEVLNILHE